MKSDIKWDIKIPLGLVSKKTLPYVSNFWKNNPVDVAYYVGITADIGMEPKYITHVVNFIYTELEKERFCNFTTNISGIEIKIDSFNELLSQLRDLSSNWYADRLWLKGYTEDTDVFLEPQSDGTEIGLFFYGKHAEAISNKFVKIFD